jgi:hypothetical protein
VNGHALLQVRPAARAAVVGRRRDGLVARELRLEVRVRRRRHLAVEVAVELQVGARQREHHQPGVA